MAKRGPKRKMEVPVMINMLLEASTIKKLDRQANALTKKHGFTVYRSDLIREVVDNYLNVSGV